MYAAALLGMAALVPGLDLPEALKGIAAGIGVEAMGALIDRVAHSDRISDEDIKQQVEKILEHSNAGQSLSEDAFWHAFKHLRKGQRSLSNQSRLIYELLRRIECIEESDVVVVDGTHYAEGVGEVTGIDVQGPAILKPGTKSTASGKGTITATRIGGRKESNK